MPGEATGLGFRPDADDPSGNGGHRRRDAAPNAAACASPHSRRTRLRRMCGPPFGPGGPGPCWKECVT